MISETFEFPRTTHDSKRVYYRVVSFIWVPGRIGSSARQCGR
jgi:hypothetical protein